MRLMVRKIRKITIWILVFFRFGCIGIVWFQFPFRQSKLTSVFNQWARFGKNFFKILF